jgi:hypothetical protein
MSSIDNVAVVDSRQVIPPPTRVKKRADLRCIKQGEGWVTDVLVVGGHVWPRILRQQMHVLATKYSGRGQHAPWYIPLEGNIADGVVPL